MQEPLEIAFHNMPSSDDLEQEIRKRFAKLDALYDRLTACRVSVEALHQQHRTGNVYEVHIDMRVPGGHLAVSREPHKVKKRFANPNVHTCIREAFKAAERQLKNYKDRLYGEVKVHADDTTIRGEIAQLYPQEDHGFILTHTGTQLYFHRNALMAGDFDNLKIGAAVKYMESVGDTGPISYKVWVAAPLDQDLTLAAQRESNEWLDHERQSS